MKINILTDSQELGLAAAEISAKILNESIQARGIARLILSTGASQFDFFKAFITMAIDWSKVEVFHLDEYIGMSETHPASFKKYLLERFLNFVPVGKMHFVNGHGDVDQNMRDLGDEINKSAIDLALIGIGENTHIAFNDPPANYETKAPFLVVELDQKCREQQFKEGWFDTLDKVPSVAITMSVHQMMQSKAIISCVPHLSKADAVKRTLESQVSNLVPATILKTHPDWSLFLDRNSASRVVQI